MRRANLSDEAAPSPVPYKVSYSLRVRDELRALIEKARAAGVGKSFLEAAKEIDARLRVYPQFGDPLIDLTRESGQIRIGTVGPLVVRFALFEDLRQVMVAVPIRALPKSGV